jgi:hyperosmotically inducible periplasmic protein
MKTHLYHLTLIATAATLFLINVPTFASESDDRIEASAQKSYAFRTYLKNDSIKLQSKDSDVTLTGTVSNASHKILAGETVMGLPGVKAVNNKLEEKSAPEEKSDAWLITKVKTTLFFHSNVNATATEVLSQNGVITLRGKADSIAQKDLTTEYAMDVEGVVTVPTSAAQTDNKDVSNKIDIVADSIDDASITALVKVTLFNHRSTSALKTTVHTKEGVVTLGGKATNAAAKDLAGKFTGDVPGVKKVINTMSI